MKNEIKICFKIMSCFLMVFVIAIYPQIRL